MNALAVIALIETARASAPTLTMPEPTAASLTADVAALQGELVHAKRQIASLTADQCRRQAETEVDRLIIAKKIPAHARSAFIDAHLADGTPSRTVFASLVGTHAGYAAFVRDVPGGGAPPSDDQNPGRIDARRFRFGPNRRTGSPEILELSQADYDFVGAYLKRTNQTWSQWARTNHDPDFPDETPAPTK